MAVRDDQLFNLVYLSLIRSLNDLLSTAINLMAHQTTPIQYNYLLYSLVN